MKKITMITLMALTILLTGCRGSLEDNYTQENATYYDYMVLETVEGEEILIDESEYTKDNKAIFEDGDKVVITYDKDNTIISVEKQ